MKIIIKDAAPGNHITGDERPANFRADAERSSQAHTHAESFAGLSLSAQSAILSSWHEASADVRRSTRLEVGYANGKRRLKPIEMGLRLWRGVPVVDVAAFTGKFLKGVAKLANSVALAEAEEASYRSDFVELLPVVTNSRKKTVTTTDLKVDAAGVGVEGSHHAEKEGQDIAVAADQLLEVKRRNMSKVASQLAAIRTLKAVCKNQNWTDGVSIIDEQLQTARAYARFTSAPPPLGTERNNSSPRSSAATTIFGITRREADVQQQRESGEDTPGLRC
jgi:hypothetical protein